MTHTWCVAPRLIVRGEDAEVAASYKLLVIHWKKRRGGRKELRMEDNLKKKKKKRNDLVSEPDIFMDYLPCEQPTVFNDNHSSNSNHVKS